MAVSTGPGVGQRLHRAVLGDEYVQLGRIGIAMIRRGQTAGRVLGIIDGALFAAPLVYFAYRAMVR